MDPAFQEKFDELVKRHEEGVIVGLKEVTGNVAPRLDIDVLLMDHEDTFNLFIIALRELKRTDFQDKMGYFQIAAIHGFPLTPWNGVPGKKSTPSEKGPNNDGYCPHGQNIFPVWHRPYIAMLEQALFILMVQISQRYEEADVKSRYLKAAKQFRLPYWDYWRPRGGEVTFPGVIDEDDEEETGSKRRGETTYPYDYSAPRIFTDENIMVRTYPRNKLEPIRNPFWHFIFSAYSGSLQDHEWKFMDTYNKSNLINRSQTTRHPFPPPSAKDIQDVQWDNPIRLNSVLNEMRMDANRIALEMLSRCKRYSEYERFSNAAKPKQNVKVNEVQPEGKQHAGLVEAMKGSLEGIHNMYHIMIGGIMPGGHMSRVPTAAFDPIFYFHHNQIERMLAIWQSIHKGEKHDWFDDPKDAAADLRPFFNKPIDAIEQYHFWNSDLARWTETFGYTYEDIQDSPDATIARLEYLYRWSVPFVSTNTRLEPPPEMQPKDVSKSQFFQLPRPRVPALLSEHQPAAKPAGDLRNRSESLKNAVSDLSKDTEIWEWEISDQVERLALNGSFAILYFVLNKDDVELDAEPYETAPTLAGLTYIFASPAEVCSNCATQAEGDVVAQNSVSITSKLMDYADKGQILSLNAEHVVPFLKKRLRWRVVDTNGNIIDPREMNNRHNFRLTVSSYKSTVGAREAGDFPEPDRHDDIITAIVGGASSQMSGGYVVDMSIGGFA